MPVPGADIVRVTAVPEVVPIRREAGYRTEFAGTWRRGQFLGNVFGRSDRAAWRDKLPDPARFTRCYTYLHEFDPAGNHLESTVESLGIGGQPLRRYCPATGNDVVRDEWFGIDGAPRLPARQGAKGQRWYDWAWITVADYRPGHWHLPIRRNRATGKPTGTYRVGRGRVRQLARSQQRGRCVLLRP